MVKVLVGSKNPVKIDSVREAFSHYFANLEVVGISVESQVPDQPVNNQTFQGAENRVEALRKLNQENKLQAEFFVGLEAGVVNRYNKWFLLTAACIADNNGKTSLGMSPHLELPDHIAEDLLQGTELRFIASKLSGVENVHQKGGIVSFLTKGIIKRKDLSVHSLVTALIPFLNNNLYFDKR